MESAAKQKPARRSSPCRGADARLNPAVRAGAATVRQRSGSEKKLNSSFADKGLGASKFQPWQSCAKVEGGTKRRQARWTEWACPPKAMAAALRGVPAQFTGIVAALQGGQRR